jgi:DNA-binding MarR family transcriptional regulator
MPRRPRRRADALYLVSGPRVPDSVDRIVAEWAAERPDLPVDPIVVLTRLSRVTTRMDEEQAAVFARHDLTAPDFTVIAALRRAGRPYTLPQSVLMDRLRLTSGTVSVRLGRLEAKGIVTRAPSQDDGRGVLVTLTAKGVELFDAVAPAHLANEDVLLSALTREETEQLAGLLRKLLVAFEHPRSRSPLGFTVEPAHRARRARAAVGLSDRAGLLVAEVEPHSAAARAGLHAGDLVVAADGTPVVSCVTLAEVAHAAATADEPLRLTVVRGEQEHRVAIERGA